MLAALRLPGMFPPKLVIAGGIALALAAPVAVLALVALRLVDSRRAEDARMALLADTAWTTDNRIAEADALLAGVEARVAALVEQLGSITKAVTAHDKALAASAARLDTGSSAITAAATAATAASTSLAAALPAAVAQAETMQSLLSSTGTDLQRQIADTEALLAGLWARASEISAATNTAAAAATGHVGAITAAAEAATAALGAPVAALGTASTNMLESIAAATTASRDALDAQAASLNASLATARTELAGIGATAAAGAAEQIAVLEAASTRLETAIDLQTKRYRIFIEQLERGFATLDAKLIASATTGKAELDAVAAAMIATRDAVNGLATPIATTHGAVAEVAGQIQRLTGATTAALTALDSALPAAQPRVASLISELEALHEGTDALTAPLAASLASITDAGERLAAARGILESIETQAGSTALAAAAELVDIFGRVRDVANQTAGTMRTTLAGVVTEAEDALEAAGQERAEAAFAAPIRAALAELNAANIKAADAAQAAAERITQRVLALTGTIATVEARLTSAEASQDARLRTDIAARSTSLLASMDAAAIDIARLVGGDIDEAAWSKWLGGERGMFIRRAVRLVDADTARNISKLWQSNSGFREAGTRFIGEFEALIARVMPEREGRNLALALLSSDPGKLYVALAQATDRLQ
jgi:predicted  nucleic acid-binding Zn-ribbon protein